MSVSNVDHFQLNVLLLLFELPRYNTMYSSLLETITRSGKKSLTLNILTNSIRGSSNIISHYFGPSQTPHPPPCHPPSLAYIILTFVLTPIPLSHVIIFVAIKFASFLLFLFISFFSHFFRNSNILA